MIIFVIKCYSYSYGTGDTVTDEHTGIDSTVIWGPTELMGDERYIMFRYINIYFECCKSCNFEIKVMNLVIIKPFSISVVTGQRLS